MLQLILQEIESAGGTVNLADLSRRLDVDPGALEGMLEFWVRKGRLRRSLQGNEFCSTSLTCAGSCGGAQGCPFVIRMPHTFSLVSNDD
jgi:DNA-binding IclR family transcriptional regulator